MSKLPKDPMILLSFINTRLRDQEPDLDELCSRLQVSRAFLEEQLAQVDFHYDPSAHQFR